MNQADYVKVKEHMLDRLWNVFGEPKAHDFEAFIDEYVKALSLYSAEDLSVGCDKVFRTLRVKSWPTIKECLDAAREAARERYEAERKARSQVPQTDQDRQAAEQEAWVLRHLEGPIGKQAAREGWILGLHDFVRDNRRLPSSGERENLKDAARYRAACARGEIDLGFAHVALRTIADDMERKNDELARRFWG